MAKKTTHSILLQIPERLYRKLVKATGRLTIKRGQRVTIVGLVRDILQDHFTKKVNEA